MFGGLRNGGGGARGGQHHPAHDVPLSQDDEFGDYLTPSDAPGFSAPIYAIASPSPIKKKCRPGRPSRSIGSLPASVNEEDEDDEDGHQGMGGGDDDYGNDFRSTSQGLSQSVLEGLRSLRMNNPSSSNSSSQEEDQHAAAAAAANADHAAMMSQGASQGFRLNSVAPKWGLGGEDEEGGDAMDADSGSQSTDPTPPEGRGEAAGGELVQVVSIPPCNTNPFIPKTEDGRKRQRQRNLKIPCRGDPGSLLCPSLSVSRYLLDFDQIDTIGTGHYSVVYQCRKRLDGAVYAVKRSRHSLESEAEKEVALREVYALAALQACPHLVRYLSAWSEDKHLYIQTEYCPGGSIERAIFGSNNAPPPPASQASSSSSSAAASSSSSQGNAKPLGSSSSSFDGSEACLLRVARDVSLALAFMHQRGIVHMDVKPGNILIAADGSFKLGDLGHAIRADGSMRVEEGDERYLSMDVLRSIDLFNISKGQEVPDYHGILAPNDIFGLGASLYELANRKRLASSGPDFHHLREGQLRPLPGFSAGFQSLVTSMLSPEARDRPTAEQVARQAEALLLGLGSGAGGQASLLAKCKDQQKRIKDLEEMVLSLTGLGS